MEEASHRVHENPTRLPPQAHVRVSRRPRLVGAPRSRGSHLCSVDSSEACRSLGGAWPSRRRRGAAGWLVAIMACLSAPWSVIRLHCACVPAASLNSYRSRANSCPWLRLGGGNSEKRGSVPRCKLLFCDGAILRSVIPGSCRSRTR